MLVPPADFLNKASTCQLDTATGPVTVQRTTPEEVPALQKLIDSPAFKARLALGLRSKQPALAFSPAILASLPLSPAALAALGPLQFPSPEPTKADLAPNATAAPQPVSMAPQYVGSPATDRSGPTASVHVTTAEELWASFGKQNQRSAIDPARVAIGASAGAAVGLGLALVRQSVGAVHPAAGVAFDLGWILIGAGLGAGASASWQLTYNPQKQTFGIMPAASA